jgi:hypothetical protein
MAKAVKATRSTRRLKRSGRRRDGEEVVSFIGRSFLLEVLGTQY